MIHASMGYPSLKGEPCSVLGKIQHQWDPAGPILPELRKTQQHPCGLGGTPNEGIYTRLTDGQRLVSHSLLRVKQLQAFA